MCFDSIEVLDGASMKSLTNGSVCAIPMPYNLTTTSNRATIVFKSDSSDAGRGFSLRYKSLCTRKLTGHSGVIESPNFPDNYPHHSDCTWTIDVPPGNKLGIEFSHFALEEPAFGDHCDYDHMEIARFDGETQIDSKRYCRDKPEPFETDARRVQIKFHSDVSQSTSGFRLEWRIQGCGGYLDRPTGRIEENNFIRPELTECTWKIVTSIGKHVEFNVSEFTYNGGAPCDEEGLMVRKSSRLCVKL